VNASTHQRTYDTVKRAFDIVGATVAFTVSLPIQAVVAIAVAAKLGRPVLFKQRRPGRDGKIFTLVKFRSMKDIDEAQGLVTDADRLTHFGKLLRSMSLDELPTLFNVMKGDMSMVGPRPLLVAYLERYTADQARRHEVRPGVTGLAQVSGRNEVGWNEKFDLDIDYVDRRCMSLDAWILWRTLSAVFLRKGISAANDVTMQEFRGIRPDGGNS